MLVWDVRESQQTNSLQQDCSKNVFYETNVLLKHSDQDITNLFSGSIFKLMMLMTEHPLRLQ